MDLEVVHPVACGLDVHAAVLAACIVRTDPKGRPRYEERSFPSTLRGLNDLRDWALGAGCSVVGMEATGVYWMPVYAALEGHFAVVVGNPQHMKNLRGHKTDRKDAKWIAGLVRHGLIRSSFVPPPVFREARELTRFRRQLVQARTSIRNEVIRLLARQGITLSDVLSDVFGVSGMAILEALTEGRSVLADLPKLIHYRLRPKLAALGAALESPLASVPQRLLRIQLDRLEELEERLQEVVGLIQQHMEPYQEQIKTLLKVPGVHTTAAYVILAEIGVQMEVWPTERHLSAWAGLAPGSRESAGKRLGASVREGNVHLATILVECASSVVRKKNCHLATKFRGLRTRLGYTKALVAIARKLLVII